MSEQTYPDYQSAAEADASTPLEQVMDYFAFRWPDVMTDPTNDEETQTFIAMADRLMTQLFEVPDIDPDDEDILLGFLRQVTKTCNSENLGVSFDWYDACARVMATTTNYLDAIVVRAQSSREYRDQYLLAAVDICTSNEFYKEQLPSLLEPYTPSILSGLQATSVDSNLELAVACVMFADGRGAGQIAEQLELLGQQRQWIKAIYLNHLISGPEPKTPVGRHFLHRQIAELGFIYPKDYYTWRNCVGDQRSAKRQNNYLNIINAMELEQKHPNIMKVLRGEFQLTLLGRYPQSVLEEMYQDALNPQSDEDYVLAVYPETDRNGAFFDQAPILESFHAALQEWGIKLKIIEADSLDSIVRRSLAIRSKYGRALAGIYAGHGSIDDMAFGEGEDGQVSLEQLIMSRAGQVAKWGIGRMYKGKPTLTLIACEVGRSGYFADQLSREYNTSIVASNASVYLISLQPRWRGEQLIVDAEFSNGQTVYYGFE